VKIKIIVLDFETPKWLRKAIAYGAPIVGVLAVAGIALAAPHHWSTNDPLTATDLNGLNVLTNGSTQYSIGATKYCGQSQDPTAGKFFLGGQTGYAASKALCQAATACGSSSTAHMCASEEIVRSRSLGISVPMGWYSTGTLSLPPMGIGTGYTVDDCKGWTTSAAGNDLGATWSTGSDFPGAQFCNNMFPVLCCD
jgi:hypothetical protein